MHLMLLIKDPPDHGMMDVKLGGDRMDAPLLRMEEPLNFGGEIVSDGHDENVSDRFVF